MLLRSSRWSRSFVRSGYSNPDEHVYHAQNVKNYRSLPFLFKRKYVGGVACGGTISSCRGGVGVHRHLTLSQLAMQRIPRGDPIRTMGVVV